MGWRMRGRSIYRVLAIGKDKYERQKLTDYYFKNLERCNCPMNARSKVYKAKGFSDAHNKTGHAIPLIVCTQDFPEIEKDKIREWLSYRQQMFSFIEVPLRLLEKVA